MSDLSLVALTGRLTRDPEAIETKSDVTLVKFGLAVNRYSKGEEAVSFFDVTSFGKTAEFVQGYLVKGSRVALDGRLEQDRWEKDGQKRSKVQVIVNNLTPLDPKPSESNGGGAAADDDIPF